ncbi:MAG TPA: NADPH-dependent FMN reductase [Candidatus Angelobacter sp.]|jgi:NAD(P)H-dependent FMN reductase|nr:NADPH-dependent FMN reductase [Candidatus Angelobacter sp.]
MFYIPVILGSIRRNRESIKVARFVIRRLEQCPSVETELLDLKELNLPMMEERLRFRDDAGPNLLEFSAKIARATSILIVTPEYSGAYPGVLKNALDYLRPEYRRKPFGIVTVSAVVTGGILCLSSLRQIVLHMGGVPIPASLMVANVQQAFDDNGNPSDESFGKRTEAFLDELLWFTEAVANQQSKSDRRPL